MGQVGLEPTLYSIFSQALSLNQLQTQWVYCRDLNPVRKSHNLACNLYNTAHIIPLAGFEPASLDPKSSGIDQSNLQGYELDGIRTRRSPDQKSGALRNFATNSINISPPAEIRTQIILGISEWTGASP